MLPRMPSYGTYYIEFHAGVAARNIFALDHPLAAQVVTSWNAMPLAME